ncbi:PepSY domain-containing protein [Eubacterium sp. AB3007]|uniref:PepSY domain-containing protein n=1 Tax=Eubacterium sp. AB3007 TaxID=1392487 RepID=UPI00068A6406|nr:PepSY domain-containing protein [Eubacterium sp. AB3007]
MRTKQKNNGKSKVMALAVLLLCLLVALGMSACGSSQEAAPEEGSQPAAEETTEDGTDAGESAEKDTQKKKIGEEAALKIAMDDAKVKASDLDSTNAQFEIDDGLEYYEVELRACSTEYSYEIEAYTGEIIDKDLDYDDGE